MVRAKVFQESLHHLELCVPDEELAATDAVEEDDEAGVFAAALDLQHATLAEDGEAARSAQLA